MLSGLLEYYEFDNKVELEKWTKNKRQRQKNKENTFKKKQKQKKLLFSKVKITVEDEKCFLLFILIKKKKFEVREEIK